MSRKDETSLSVRTCAHRLLNFYSTPVGQLARRQLHRVSIKEQLQLETGGVM